MSQTLTEEKRVVVIGGGPAGLTAAYELTRHGEEPVVLEQREIVGGLSRTESYRNFHFDMGGHRFFTKSHEVNRMWHEVLTDDFLKRPRLSRIFYNSRFFNYPLKPLNALWGLGMVESVLIMISYVRWKLFPYKVEETFEQWVTNRFGRRLFLTFFKTYTEKVWGISCTELKAEWAAQRIKDLSLKSALMSMFFKPKTTIKTLIEQFEYPRRGPGMMWTKVKDMIEERGGEVRLQSNVVKIQRTGQRIDGVVISRNGVGSLEEVVGTDFISSMPINEFVKKLEPPAPDHVLEAAKSLKYRDFLTVCLIIDKKELFPDNWIYIHDPSVLVGRIQNFKNWSPDMVPDQSKTSLGLEYFCTVGDSLWTKTDADLVELAKVELGRIGLAKIEDIEDGCVFRVPYSYPIYDADYREHLDVVRGFVDSLENFQTIGRNGLHRYNNQDHAMLTGILAVKNMMLGEQNDLWNVNSDQEYHEETTEESETEQLTLEALAAVFRKLDRAALGVAGGAACGLAMLLVTLFATLTHSASLQSPGLNVLGNYFPGYRVSLFGSLLGMTYGFATGFLLGWLFAFTRNTVLFLSVAIPLKRARVMRILRQFMQYV